MPAVSPAQQALHAQQQTAQQASARGEATLADTNANGMVRTTEGAPVPGAMVRLTNVDTNKAWLSWTDQSGKFEFPALPTSRYRIEVSQLGFVQASLEVQLPVVPSGAIPLVLRVATLAELEGRPAPSAPNKSPGEKSNATGQRGGKGSSANASGAVAQGPRGRNGGGPMPAGVVNAIRQGLAGDSFQQAELTGESGTNGAGEGDTSQASAAAQSTAGASTSGAGASTSDSFLIQGTVGQGLSFNGPGGPPGGGFNNLAVGGPEGPGGPGGQAGGSPGGPVGGGPGGEPGGGPGGRPGFVPPGGGQFPGGFGGRGGQGRGGRLFRQQVNRIRFGFMDRYENSIWDAKPYSITGAEAPKTAHYDERIGANAGGPLRIPHIYNGNDRTFFFVNYQHEIQKSAVDNLSTVPTQDERNGNFCGVSGIQLYNPYSSMTGTRAALGCNLQTDSIPLDKAAQGLLTHVPPPNLPGTVQNFQLLDSTPFNSDSLNLHVLHTINSKFNLNGGYNFNSQRSDALGDFPGFGSHQSTRNQNVDLGLGHNWSATVVENLHLNWSRSRAQVLSNDSYGTDIAANLGITGVSSAPINYGVPSISFTNFSGLNDPIPSLIRNQTLRLSDGVIWTHLKHTMRFGGEVRRIQLNSESDPNPRGQFTFTGLLTSQLDPTTGQALVGTGNDFADFLLGFPEATAVQFAITSNMYLRSWGFVAYAQDDWRVNKKFTFEYGLRYEAVTPPIELFNHFSTIEFNSGVTAAAAVTPGQSGPYSGASYPRALVHGDYGNWEPRIGFAWQPPVKPKTIVRGGYSIFYNESIYNTLAKELTYQSPWATSQSLLTSATQVLTLENGFPSQAGFLSNTEGVNPNYKPGSAQLWMLGAETDLSRNWILNLTYTGTKGANLDLLRIPNRAPLGTPSADTQQERSDPNATGFLYDQSGANSIYNALQVRLVHRFTSGFTLQGIYTFAKSLDNASSIGGGTPVIVQQDGNYAAERGLSSFDIRHQFRAYSMYELPLGERKRWANHGMAEHVLGNWRLMNIFTWQMGIPYTALLGGNASDNGTGTNFSLRTDQTGDPNMGICGGTSVAFFNTAVFGAPALGQYGNEHRGAIEGPCTFSWNASLAKSFRFGPSERGRRLEARWEVQNLTNTPNFAGLATTYGSSFFGRVTSAGSMRTMDFTLRMNF